VKKLLLCPIKAYFLWPGEKLIDPAKICIISLNFKFERLITVKFYLLNNHEKPGWDNTARIELVLNQQAFYRLYFEGIINVEDTINTDWNLLISEQGASMSGHNNGIDWDNRIVTGNAQDPFALV